VQPNTSVALSTPGKDETMENTSKTTEVLSALGEKTTTTEFTLGALKKLTASINVPRTYLAGIHSRQAGNEGKTASDKDIDATAQKEFVKIRKQVLNAIGAVDEKLVAVDWFDDGMATLVGEGLAGGSEETSTLGLLNANARKIGLGVLAAISLVMMLMMVRKGPAGGSRGKGGGPASVEPEADLGLLHAGMETIGEVGTSEAAMEGHEIDDSAVETEQRVEQVATLVKEDPEAAANLVRRWLSDG